MAKIDLKIKWAQQVQVAHQSELNEQYHSSSKISQEQAAQQWLAFRELYKDGHIVIKPSNETVKAMSFYREEFKDERSQTVAAFFKNRNKDPIAEWANKNPHNLLLIDRTGADFFKAGTGTSMGISGLLPFLHEVRTGERVHIINHDEAQEIFKKHFHPVEEEHALKLMESKETERTQKMLRYTYLDQD